MEVTDKTVAQVAKLANLKLSKEETLHYQNQLKKIIDYVDELSSVDDSLGDDWRNDDKGSATPLREDVVKKALEPEEALSQAPKSTGTAFKVPRIIE